MRVLPSSLLGRTALVLVAAVLVSLGAALALFVSNRVEALAALGGRNAAERIGGLVNVLEETDPAGRRQLLRRMDSPGMRAGWGINPLVSDREPREGMARDVVRLLSRTLAEREVRASAAPPLPPPPPEMRAGEMRAGEMRSGEMRASDMPPGEMRGPGPDDDGEHDRDRDRDREGGGPGFGPGGFGIGHGLLAPALRVSVRLRDDTWLNVLAPIDSGEPLWRLRFVGPLLIALLLVMPSALWAVWRATRPLATFTNAARRLGTDVNAPPMAETGPREVRDAAHAFNVMQERIRRFVEDRTQMLAAISHDLRTPITRMRLRAEFVDDDEQRLKMLADLEEMEHMIAATLAFARDDATREETRPVDLAALVQGLATDLGASYDGPEKLVVPARSMALKRAVANVIENARKYGGAARTALRRADGHVLVVVDDDGPGIPAEQWERVFAPFFRLETSRNRDTGGTGLGLAVARAALRAHGGDVLLANRPEGGLRVTLTIPVS